MFNSKLKVVSKYNIQNFPVSSVGEREWHKDRQLNPRQKLYLHIQYCDASIFHKFHLL